MQKSGRGCLFEEEVDVIASCCSSLGLRGCQGQEEEPVPLSKEEETDTKEEEIQEYPVEISGNLYDFQFAIDGEVKSLPSRIQEWIRQGWEYPKRNKKPCWRQILILKEKF